MKITAPAVACLVGVLAALAEGAPVLPDDPEGRAMMQAAQRAIAGYHAGEPKAEEEIRVVYFHPSDREPWPNYAERLDRALTDVSDFYRDGFRRFGIETGGPPFERKEGKAVFHLVRGRHPASGYGSESGRETTEGIRTALRGAVDLEREHVLVLYGLGRRETDGRYVWDCPYYGSGTQRSGIGHATDCELLDPALLTETKGKILHQETLNPRLLRTVAEFNSWYLGGIAHELGHGLGLFHDAGARGETPGGTPLMGSGNRHYRNKVWGGPKPAYLSRATALHLLSHPLITGSNRGRWEEVGAGIEAPHFSAERGALAVHGRVSSAIPSYAVVAYVWETNTTDHESRTFLVLTTDDGFELRVAGLRPAQHFLRLSSLHVNGAAVWADYRFAFDAAGNPTTPQRVGWEHPADDAEKAVLARRPDARRLLTDEVIAAAPTDEARRKLRVLRGIIESSSQPCPSNSRWWLATVRRRRTRGGSMRAWAGDSRRGITIGSTSRSKTARI